MKLFKIDSAFPKGIERDVAYMIATSHEYKTPNEDAAIRLVKNYKWERKILSVSAIQGINKPVDKEKVFDISKKINQATMTPLMVVDKFQGITPQSKGKKILLDGHHRLEACSFKGIKEVPVYYGKYTGNAEKSIDELIEKKALEIMESIEKYASKSPFQKLKEGEVKLSPEERKKVMNSKAVWHFNGKGPTPAVWKSVDEKTGKVTYVTNTHRAYNTAPTLKGAIGRFHRFIKSTASEFIDTNIEKCAGAPGVSVSALATLGGAAMVKKQFDNGNLTGREKVYHNTNKKNVKSIRQSGILASKALDPNNLTHSASGDFLSDEDMAGLTYVARKRTPAIGVMMASANRDAKNPRSKNYKNNFGALADRKTLVADIPRWKMTTVANPELQGATNPKELGKILEDRWHKRIDKQYGNSLSAKVLLKPGSSLSAKLLRSSIYDQLGKNGTHVIKGDISPKYIRGSQKYRYANKDEITEYIRENPSRFKKGVMGAGIGAALGTAGAIGLAKELRKG